jgi:hypothetical protein
MCNLHAAYARRNIHSNPHLARRLGGIFIPQPQFLPKKETTPSSPVGGKMLNSTWHKSSFSASGGCVEAAAWTKSSFSGDVGCIEVNNSEKGVIALRDSKDKNGPVLKFNFHEWDSFLKGVRNDEFNLPE